jgi:hypothetical protein
MGVLQFEDLLELEDLRRNVLFCDLNSDELQMIEKMSLPYISKEDLDKQPTVVDISIYSAYLKAYSTLRKIYIKKSYKPYKKVDLNSCLYLVEYFQQLYIELDIEKALKLDEVKFLDKLFSYKDILKDSQYEKLIEKRYKWLKSQ